LVVVRLDPEGPFEAALKGGAEALSGLAALDLEPNLRVVLIPELSFLEKGAFDQAFAQCREFLEPRRLFLLLDPPPGLPDVASAIDWVETSIPADAGFCAAYYPYLKSTFEGVTLTLGASGAMAALYERNDLERGVWDSPSGSDLPISLSTLWPSSPTTAETELLNVSGLCAIRSFTGPGVLPWGARTLDRVNGENRYIPVVRTRQWIAASIERSLAFAATEENAEPLWTRIRGLVDEFLLRLHLRGALLGGSPPEAYFVRCDASTVSAADLAANRVRVVYGLALLRPAEFEVNELMASTLDKAAPTPTPAMVWRQPVGGVLLGVPTVAGFRYELEASDSLEPGSFTGIGVRWDGDGTWRTHWEPADPARTAVLFRLRVEPMW
jgi:phage tail sheath protein FI